VSIHEASTEPPEPVTARDLPPSRLRAIGYWVEENRPELPDPAMLVDLAWDIEERQAVANFLNAGRSTSVGCGCSPCRICGAPNGFEEFTDGVYLWPEGLAHYVLDHGVRLPREIVRHALTWTEAVGLVDTTWWIKATS
jgi:hypothetical protein